MDILDLVKADGYITVSKELANEIGLNETVILIELISKYKYFKNRNQLDKEGYFYCTVDDLKKSTTLNKYYQGKAISKLEKLNLIDKDIKGVPSKRHFKINYYEVKKLFNRDENSDNPRHESGENYSPPRSQHSKHLDSNTVTTNNNNYNNNKTEEEETAEILQKIQSKFQQIFNRQLSVEFYQEITKIYSNTDIILKALSICEKQADKPIYLLKILKDWRNNELEAVTGINTYIENRQAQKALRQSNKKTTATRSETPEEELQRLYEKGYR